MPLSNYLMKRTSIGVEGERQTEPQGNKPLLWGTSKGERGKGLVMAPGLRNDGGKVHKPSAARNTFPETQTKLERKNLVNQERHRKKKKEIVREAQERTKSLGRKNPNEEASILS